jgi:geranylgeranyl diphosphate synthase type II
MRSDHTSVSPTFGKLAQVPFQTQLKAYARSVDERLEALLPLGDAEPAELHEAMRYSALAPGKRLRPALALASARAAGGDERSAIDGACAVELVHCFSLIHDDLPALDNDDLRRGLPTAHVRFGEAVAILAGDALFAMAFEALASAEASADRIVQAVRALTRATSRLVVGESLDILSEGQPITKEVLAAIHEQKTGALIAASCRIGAILGGGSVSQVEALERFGAHVGLAFQIADDILNETSTPQQLGKSTGSDRQRGKATYPALYGLESSKQAALSESRSGIAELDGLPDSGFLVEMANYAVERLS